ncbi:MAG: WGR domain-containing protein [Deltaproteobacteria bacterium]|nr:WGR domain-containing protein [Deltaproteobacteria bacterium]
MTTTEHAAPRSFLQRADAGDHFWTIHRDGNAVHLHWGVVGTRGSRLVKELPSEGKARAEYERLVRQRIGMGYVEQAER